jgi:hypothetical protein
MIVAGEGGEEYSKVQFVRSVELRNRADFLSSNIRWKDTVVTSASARVPICACFA